MRHAASEAESNRDPEDYKPADKRTVAAELDNYINFHSSGGTHEPYKAIKRYLDSVDEYAGPYDDFEDEEPYDYGQETDDALSYRQHYG